MKRIKDNKNTKYQKKKMIPAPYYVLKRVLENGNPTAHVVYAKHFCNVLVLYSLTVVPPSQF